MGERGQAFARRELQVEGTVKAVEGYRAMRYIWLVWQEYDLEDRTLETSLQGCYNSEARAIKVSSNLNRVYKRGKSWVESWELSDD